MKGVIDGEDMQDMQNRLPYDDYDEVALDRLTNPFEIWPWCIEFCPERPLTSDEVNTAILRGQTEETWFRFGNGWTRERHVARVAYLCMYPSTEPIRIGVRQNGGITILDGHHRIAAARFTGKTTIRCVAAGCLDAFYAAFDEG